MSSDDADRSNRWLRTARAVWLLVLAAVLARVLIVNRSDVADLAQVQRPWLLGAALLAGFGQLGVNASFWRRALAATGRGVPWRTILEVTARSVPARYVPGSVWYAMSRAAMLRARGVGISALAVTAILEAVLTVVVSLALGGALLGLAGQLPGRQLSAVVWVVVVVIATAPPVLNRILTWLVQRRGTTAPALSWADHIALVTWMAAFWALSAAAFTCYLLAFDVDVPGLAAVAGAFLVAWGIGFLTPIAPQGAGAFEVVVVALLVGGADGPLAVVVAGFRALIGVRDTVAFAWGAWRGGSGSVPRGRLEPDVRSASRPAPAARRSG